MCGIAFSVVFPFTWRISLNPALFETPGLQKRPIVPLDYNRIVYADLTRYSVGFINKGCILCQPSSSTCYHIGLVKHVRGSSSFACTNKNDFPVDSLLSLGAVEHPEYDFHS
ncbi:Hypothetical protein NTJ_01257 [Nesidiocoris tenuis]|uniref:Peptidase A1 domain-containing protein n=1 Tax=Nesidiocoris tenuis TaxID=355587 RepID=A0ABN7A851_9HEMI|nr:Hypothetical protein NTJ_01257 [Nesidiocoris tenuis]